MTDDLAQAMLAEMRRHTAAIEGLRADLRRMHDPEPAWRWLAGVLADELHVFNAEAVRDCARTEPELAAALRASGIDTNGDPRSVGTRIGIVLGRMVDAGLLVRAGAHYTLPPILSAKDRQ